MPPRLIVFINEAVIVEHGVGYGYEVAIQHMHDVVGQVIFAMSREVADVGEEDCEFKLLSFSSSHSMQLVEIQDHDILWIIREPADDHVAVNPRLAGKASEFVPAPSGCHLLLARVSGGDMRDPVQNLDATGCAAPPSATLMSTSLDVIWQTLPDEIESRHSSLGGELGERIAVVKDAKHGLCRREQSSRP